MLIERRRGKAKAFLCVVGEGDHQAQAWAHIHDTDREDIRNYQTMCTAHHNAYDYTDERREEHRKAMLGNKNRLGATASAETRKKLSEAAKLREARKRGK